MQLTGSSLTTVAFPLGGIGTGTVSLGGRGDLRDWEIFNAPAKGDPRPVVVFLVRVRVDGGPTVCRVLERRFFPPYVDRPGMSDGTGMREQWLAGLPRFADATLRGEYPIAVLTLEDPAVPVRVGLTAWNPMVPLDDSVSGMPVALLDWSFHNSGARPVQVSVAAVVRNPMKRLTPATVTTRRRRDLGLTGLEMEAADADPARCGTLVVATATPDSEAHAALAGTEWFDAWHLLWDEFSAGHPLRASVRNEPAVETTPTDELTGVLVSDIEIATGTTGSVPITIAWHVPDRPRASLGFAAPSDPGRVRNWYADQWPDAWAVATAATTDRMTLLERTTRFRDVLFGSTLPSDVRDAVSSQMSTIRTTTCTRLADGTLHAFEGCNDSSGCCALDCTHVWNYEQSLAFLYPALERTMRDTDLQRNLHDDGRMAFRTVLPLTDTQPGIELDDSGRWDFRPAADGQLGTVVKVYREWLLHGDLDWLKTRWLGVRRVLDYAHATWDPHGDGLATGEQHNTYDVEFYGPNPMIGLIYLAALSAGAQLATAVGDDVTRDNLAARLESGRVRLEQELWNGSWYVQRVPPADAAPGARRAPDGSLVYQFGEGCLSDQLLGQWMADVVGLGPLVDPGRLQTALRSIVRHNRVDLAEHANVQRVYALPGEGGLVLCTWPEGDRPQLPFPYADEVWTGVEYAVAATCIYAGLVDEGLDIVAATRSRHAGWNRNPWNEFECGHHYARAMSSWSLLLALSGYHYDAANQALGFTPYVAGDFRCLFTAGTAWGELRIDGDEAVLDVVEGRLDLRSFAVAGVTATYDPPLRATPGKPLQLNLVNR